MRKISTYIVCVNKNFCATWLLKIIVQLSSFNRKVEFEVPSDKTEREVLVEQIRASYSEQISTDSTAEG